MEDNSKADFQDFPQVSQICFESWNFSSEWKSELKAFKLHKLENTVK